jgi:hypothetical protein
MKIVESKFKAHMIVTDLRLLVETMNGLDLLYQLTVPFSMHDNVRLTVRGPEESVAKLARTTGLLGDEPDRGSQLAASHATEDFLAAHGDPHWPDSVKADGS